jgi:hypothetical protein
MANFSKIFAFGCLCFVSFVGTASCSGPTDRLKIRLPGDLEWEKTSSFYAKEITYGAKKEPGHTFIVKLKAGEEPMRKEKKYKPAKDKNLNYYEHFRNYWEFKFRKEVDEWTKSRVESNKSPAANEESFSQVQAEIVKNFRSQPKSVEDDILVCAAWKFQAVRYPTTGATNLPHTMRFVNMTCMVLEIERWMVSSFEIGYSEQFSEARGQKGSPDFLKDAKQLFRTVVYR